MVVSTFVALAVRPVSDEPPGTLGDEEGEDERNAAAGYVAPQNIWRHPIATFHELVKSFKREA